MKLKKVINSIIDGQAPGVPYASDKQFLASIAIDPEESIENAGVTTASKIPGIAITPIGYSTFNSSGLSGAPMWIITNPKNSNIYVYADDGDFISYSSAISAASESVIADVDDGNGSGAAYYNNYTYLATTTDIARYGPLDNSPTLTTGVWTGATLGSQTALGGTTFPSTRSVMYPKYPMHVHTDNKLYFGDFVTAANSNKGKGVVHFIKTTRTTNEGDTNDGSLYNALDLPFGYKIFDIESFGTDLAILASQVGSDTTINQGHAALFLWDTISDSFYRQIDLPCPLGTALLSHGGTLYIWGGSIDFGYQLYEYSGGFAVKPVGHFMDNASPPFAGAVDAYGDRISWGTVITYPSAAAVVMSLGYQTPGFSDYAFNNIVKASTSTNTLPIISAIKYAQATGRTKYPLIGWRTDTSATYGLEKRSGSATLASTMQWQFTLNQRFQLTKLTIPLAGAVDSNTTITVKVYMDSNSSSTTLTTINNTNYPSKRKAVFKTPELVNAAGKNDFTLEISHTGTTALPVVLPIIIEGDVFDDE